jgi:phosphoglycerate dehydrogenase-like enzyme
MQSTDRPKVVTTLALATAHRARLEEKCTVVWSNPADFPEVIAADLATTEALLISSKVSVTPTLLTAMPKLRVISTSSVGYDHIDLAEAWSRGITVTTAPNRRDALAEVVFLLMLMLARRAPEALVKGRSTDWTGMTMGHDLVGKRLLLVGLGGTGLATALRAHGFGMNVSFFDVRTPSITPPWATRAETLEEGLAQADWVSLHVDLNPSTRRLIDARLLGRMKAGAYLINTSRGGVVDQTALVAALRSGQLAGAGLDVLEDEPPAADEPLLAMDNVIVLPHLGFATHEIRTAMFDCAIDNLFACLHGQPCEYILSPGSVISGSQKDS